MKKRSYRAQAFTTIMPEGVGPAKVLALDIAKRKIFAALMNEHRETLCTVTFNQPEDVGCFVGWVRALQTKPDVVLEASGTYGDVLLHRFAEAGFDVYQANVHRVHAARELYDGVPSLHDAKSAHVIARLHLEGATELWRFKSREERALHALVSLSNIYRDEFQRLTRQLEARLARHWPELPVKPGTATCNALLSAFPGPARVAASIGEATQLLCDVGGRFFFEKVPQVIAAAIDSQGVKMQPEEEEVLASLADEAERARLSKRAIDLRIAKKLKTNVPAKFIVPICGPVATASLLAHTGDPRRYRSGGAYLKALGINIKEKSRGNY